MSQTIFLTLSLYFSLFFISKKNLSFLLSLLSKEREREKDGKKEKKRRMSYVDMTHGRIYNLGERGRETQSQDERETKNCIAIDI